MNRRQILGGLGAAGLSVGGVLALDKFGFIGDRFPTIDVSADPVDSARNISLETSVINHFNEKNPARIKISLTNTGETERQFRFGQSPPFSEYLAENNKLALIPENHEFINYTQSPPVTDDHTVGGDSGIIPTRPRSGCWRLAGEIAISIAAKPLVLSPGEQISETYSILGTTGSLRCLPPSQYRFVDSFYFGREEPWGLTVIIN